MSRIHAICLLMLAPILVFGQHRSVDEAEALAEQYVNKWKGKYSTAARRLTTITFPVDSLRMTVQSTRSVDVAKEADSPIAPFYVFNDTLNSSFIIISADKRMKTVLGYTDNGLFEYSSAPDALKYMMGQYAREYDYLQTVTVQTNTAIQKVEVQAVSPLVSTKWNQHSPYNRLLPYVSGKQAVTGCVATAMAQIMNYYKYPAAGIGQHSYSYSSATEDIFQDFSTTSFNWESMRDVYKSDFTETEANAVATLMRCCGISVNMMYGKSSSSYSSDVPYALRTYFGYNDNLVYYEKDYFNNEEWHAIIHEELNAGRPVFYGGGNGSGGHAFVLDGCDTDGLYHINWGWGGMYDGYYSLTAMTPGDDYYFNYSQHMICRIAPNTFGEEETVFHANSFLPVSDAVKESSKAQFYLATARCYSNQTSYSQNIKESWTISLGLYDDRFEYIKDLDSYSVELSSHGSTGHTFSFMPCEANLVEGNTYYVAPLVRRAGDGKPTRIRTLRGETDFCEVILSEGKLEANIMNTFQKDGVRYHILDNGQNKVEVMDCFSGAPMVSIPECITHRGEEYIVSSIGYGAFKDCRELTAIDIPKSVTRIEENAFYGCSNLTSITIPDGMVSMGKYAFCECKSLTSMIIPNSVTEIGYGTFMDCSSLTSITFPISVSTIEDCTLYGCSGLTEVFIPNNVTRIGEGAFYRCYSLTSVILPDSVTAIEDYTFEKCSGLVSIIIPNGVAEIGYGAFWGCSSLESINIPNSVMRIGEQAFTDCSNLKSVIIPDGITSIEAHTFHGCSSLTSVSIPNSVLSIGARAFKFCSSLPSIDIPFRVTAIGERAFRGCSALASIKIPDNVRSIGNEAFYDCTSLTSITIPAQVKNIGYGILVGCSGLESINVSEENAVYDSRNESNALIETSSNTLIAGCGSTTIPSSVTSIGKYAFKCCTSLTSITIPNSVTVLEDYAFNRCSNLISVSIPNSVTSIGNYAFYGCSSLTSISIPNSVTGLGVGAFEQCTELTSIIIPNSVANIGKRAFYDCTSLKQIYALPTTAIACDPSIFSSSTYTEATLHIPEGSEESYSSTIPWSNFTMVQAIPTFIRSIVQDNDIDKDGSIYDLRGIKMHDIDNLPNGLYIKNGKKLLIE